MKQGRAGFMLGAIAIALGVVGYLIVTDAFEELDDDFDCLGETDTSAEFDACDEES